MSSQFFSDVHIVGTLSNTFFTSQEFILHALSFPCQELEQGGEFTGKLQTQVFLHKNVIIKCKLELNFSYEAALAWTEATLAKETLWRIHHPQKTWFIVKYDNFFIPGNATPYMLPLHIALGVMQAEDSRRIYSRKIITDIFQQLFEQYFRFVQATQKRQDEGLSNFGIDHQHKLFYLDDDIYLWDNFTTFSQMLGVYLRSLPHLDRIMVQIIASCLTTSINRFSKQPKNHLKVLANLLGDIYIGMDLEPHLNWLITELESSSSNTKNTASQSYFSYSKEEPSSTLLAVMADIHSNLYALEAVLDDMKHQAVEKAIVLGDIVGYGPQPQECIQRLQSQDFTVIQGNHDNTVASGQHNQYFSENAQLSAQWTHQILSESDKRWLATLPPIIKMGRNWFVHGAPMDPSYFNAYVYHMTYEKNINFMREHNILRCFYGHTHLPGVYARTQDGIDELHQKEDIDLNAFIASLICPGSVGQPRNGQSCAQYLIWHQATDSVIYRSVEYDIEATLKAMDKQGFPTTLKAFQRKLLLGNV
ncbi:MAG: metallophosphoesterase family protein [Pseudomonadota bacterium]